MCEVTGSRRASADQPKGGLKGLYVAAFMGKAKDWNESNSIMVKQQHVYSSQTLQQSSFVCPD